MAAEEPIALRVELAAPIQFDQSPPLHLLPPQSLPASNLQNPPIDRDTGLEGQFGPQDIDPLVQDWMEEGREVDPGSVLHFDGPSNLANVTPPDPVGAVGPDHYVAMSNVYFAVYSKTGSLLYGPVANNTLWAGFGGACQTENSGDPIVIYDQLADRWLLSQFTTAGPTYYICLALSTGPNPLGSYYRYALDLGSVLGDYPKIGMWPDGYYLTIREFLNGSTYQGVSAFALNRQQMLAGNPVLQVIGFNIPPIGANLYNTGDGLLPADLDGFLEPPAGSPNYMMGSMDDGGPYAAPQDALTLWRFHADFANPVQSTFTLAATLPTAPFDSIFPCSPGPKDCIPQPGTATKLDFLSYRQRPMWRLAYRNLGTHESLVTNQAVETTGSFAGLRWYEIRDPGGTPVIFQQGTYAPGSADGLHRWTGSIAMDHAGNIGLGYSVSGLSTFPGIRATGRTAGDIPGVMPMTELQILAGTGSQTGSSRWGDYTSMNVDPVDDCTFWYVNEYLPVTSTVGWRLHIGAFRFYECAAVSTTHGPFCNTIAMAIPDNNTTGVSTHSLVSNDARLLSALQLSIRADHSWVGDLKFTLTHHTSATSINPIDRPGVPGSTFGCSSDNIDVLLDDNAGLPVETACATTPPAISGTRSPNQPLASFAGQTIAGDWELAVSDNAGGDTGTLLEWCLVPWFDPPDPCYAQNLELTNTIFSVNKTCRGFETLDTDSSQVQAGATLTLVSPATSIGPGFRVADGARLWVFP